MCFLFLSPPSLSSLSKLLPFSSTHSIAVWGLSCCGFNFSHHLEDHLTLLGCTNPALCREPRADLPTRPSLLHPSLAPVPYHLSESGRGRGDFRQKSSPPAAAPLIPRGLAITRGALAIRQPWLATTSQVVSGWEVFSAGGDFCRFISCPQTWLELKAESLGWAWEYFCDV